MSNFVKITLAFSIVFCLFFLNACTQKTDDFPTAYYDFPTDSTVQVVKNLPSAVKESSGIVLIDNYIWTHNDSGDDPILYQLDKKEKQVLQEVTIEATARDWEDIAHNDSHVFIGDFGNNAGKRQDLALFKVDKQDLLDGNETAKAEKMSFTYPDRTDFKPAAYQHNFDCEAIFALEDSIFLFSKNHLDQHTRLYSLANNLKEQTAHLKARFDTKGMITGAAINKADRVVALIGYNLDSSYATFGPFVWLFWDYPNNDFFAGKSRRINMPLITQMEGICHFEGSKFYISSEKTSHMKGKLVVFDSKNWMLE
jgi:hypothetical protein